MTSIIIQFVFFILFVFVLSILVPVLLKKFYINKTPVIVKRHRSFLFLSSIVITILFCGVFYSFLHFTKKSVRFGLKTGEKVTLKTIDTKISTTDSFKVLFKLDKAEEVIFDYKEKSFAFMDDANTSVKDYFAGDSFDAFFECTDVTLSAAVYILDTYNTITDFATSLKLPRFLSRKIDNGINAINSNKYFVVANNAVSSLNALNDLRTSGLDSDVYAAKSILDETFISLQNFFNLFNNISITAIFDVFTDALYEIIVFNVEQIYYIFFFDSLAPVLLICLLIILIFVIRHIVYALKNFIAKKKIKEPDEKNFILDKKKKKLVSYKGKGGEILIPETVERIMSFSFAYFSKPGNLVIPESVTKIEKYAFADCKGIESVVINSDIKFIPESCFENCKNLKKVVLPASVASVGNNAFRNCTSLEEINLPDNLKINKKGFSGCPAINRK